ncbi:hypothetical protein [Mesorhizobium sp. M0146]|uniref:hypothetical protein n=1 Tax=unclassified Mesorhizobium TaxID=325217 RepID=UPI00333602EE
MGAIIENQFGAYGGQPWFIPGTPGAQFIKRDFEAVPFVMTYIVPLSGFVGPEFGTDLQPPGSWVHLDYHDYGDEVLDDAAFAKAYRDRDPEKVVTRPMIEDGLVEEHGS